MSYWARPSTARLTISVRASPRHSTSSYLSRVCRGAPRYVGVKHGRPRSGLRIGSPVGDVVRRQLGSDRCPRLSLDRRRVNLAARIEKGRRLLRRSDPDQRAHAELADAGLSNARYRHPSWCAAIPSPTYFRSCSAARASSTKHPARLRSAYCRGACRLICRGMLESGGRGVSSSASTCAADADPPGCSSR